MKRCGRHYAPLHAASQVRVLGMYRASTFALIAESIGACALQASMSANGKTS